MIVGVKFSEDDLTGVFACLDVIGIREFAYEILVGVCTEDNFLVDVFQCLEIGFLDIDRDEELAGVVLVVDVVGGDIRPVLDGIDVHVHIVEFKEGWTGENGLYDVLSDVVVFLQETSRVIAVVNPYVLKKVIVFGQCPVVTFV